MQCNLMWICIALNLYQLTDSKVHLHITKVNNCRSNNITRSYHRRSRSHLKSMVDSFW